MTELIGVIPVGDILGEGVLWNPADQCFWWTDIQARRLHRHELATNTTQTFEAPERLCSFAFVRGEAGLLAAFETGLALFQPQTGQVTWLARPETAGSGLRFNDGRVDRQGRFWVGTMCEDESRRPMGSAALYRFDGRGELTRQLEGVSISNGLCWSPDGSRLYFADSPRQTISSFDFDADAGTIANRRTFATTMGDAYPDGATVDAEGRMWSCQWGGGQVLRYRPDGSVDFALRIPASQVTCAAFGGPDLDILCVTTARDGLGASSLDRQPQAGHAFLYRTQAAGLEEVSYFAR